MTSAATLRKGASRELGRAPRSFSPACRGHAWLRAGLTIALASLVLAHAAGAGESVSAGLSGAGAERDGQHDFDALVGTWKVELKLLKHPLSGSHEWVAYQGIQVTKKIWGGRGILEEISAHTLAGDAVLEGLTIRLYNSVSHQWSIYWASTKKGAFYLPPTVGRFVEGRGEFYHVGEFEGRPIFVRYVWSDLTPTSAHFEQSFSEDGGRTWEANSIDHLTRVAD